MTAGAFKTAMVLAAGLGQRMQPLSSVLPKPALPLPDGPVVASALKLAASAGATRIVVNVSHLAARMAEAVSEVSIGGVEIALSFEDELMGSAGGLAIARDRGLLGTEDPVLVINGDGALGLDLEGFAEHHLGRGDLVTLALLPHLDPERWSRVVLDADERITAIHPPGRADPLEVPFLYPGVMAVHREALNALPARHGEIPVNLWQPAREEGRLGGLVMAGHWREVGSPSDYLEVMLLRLAGSAWIHPSARASAGASIRNSFVGRDTVVSDRAIIEDSVIAEGALVGHGARVTRSVLLGPVEVAANEHVDGKIRASAR
jgi:mannose-1-phosphate guanylyltransferase